MAKAGGEDPDGAVTLPTWPDVWRALGDGATAALVAELRAAESGGARIVRGAHGHLRLDLTPAYPDADALGRARARLMPYAAEVATALARLEVPSAGATAVGGEERTVPVRMLRPEPPPIVRIESGEALLRAVEALSRRPAFALDTETTGLSARNDRLRLIQLGVPDAAYVIDTWRVEDLSALGPLLADPGRQKVGQNLKFDLGFLAQRGLEPVEGLFDTMLAAQLLSAGEEGASHNLRALMHRYLGLALDKEEQRSDWSAELTEGQMAYAALDVSLLLPLADALAERLAAAGMSAAATIEMAALRAVSDLERSGMAVDGEALGRALRELGGQREEAAARARAVLPAAPDGQVRLLPEAVLLSSPAEVARAFRSLGLDVPDAREESLSRHAERDEVRAYLAWRHLDKRFAFLDGLARFVVPGPAGEGRVYPDYWQIGASSGRMSCSNPNLQQVPRDVAVRRLFRAPPGRRLVIADYSQIELRIVAAMSEDARMLDAFGRGEDLHRVTAALLSGKAPEAVSREERQAAKAANFGLVYSMGARGLMDYARQGYGVAMDLAEATRLRERFFAAYPGLVAWHARLRREGEGAAETRTAAGRVRRFARGARAGDLYNAPVQGTGADIFKAALGRVLRALPAGDHLVGAVHDEIVVECDETRAEAVAESVRLEMEAAARSLVGGVPFPVEAHVGQDWSEK